MYERGKKKVFQGNISPSLTFGTGEKSISFLQAYSTSVKEKAGRRSFSSPLKREAPSRLLNNLNKREMDERVGDGGSTVDCSFCRGGGSEKARGGWDIRLKERAVAACY